MRLLTLVVVLSCACASSPAPSAPTPAAKLKVPAGLLACVADDADAVLEVDVARLRQNPLVGPLLARLPALPGGVDLEHADTLIVAAARIGEADAATVIWQRGEKLDARRAAAETSDAEAIDGNTLAIGPAPQRACGGGPGEALLRLRERAIPAGAPGASVRLFARLSDRARAQLASLYDLHQIPREVSLWGDVADDAAVVAILDEGADMLADRVRQLGIGDVRVAGDRVTWTVGPRELERRAHELARQGRDE